MAVKMRRRPVHKSGPTTPLAAPRNDKRRSSKRRLLNTPEVSRASAHDDEDDIHVSIKREQEPRFDWDKVRRENGL
jgi:hypothetical protein